jgi:hypothetical protein
MNELDAAKSSRKFRPPACASHNVEHRMNFDQATSEAVPVMTGPFRRPCPDGTYVYFARTGEEEWRAPLIHDEGPPGWGVDWWWACPLSEMVEMLLRIGTSPARISEALNVQAEAVNYFTPREEAQTAEGAAGPPTRATHGP